MRARANIRRPPSAGFVSRLLAFIIDVVIVVWTTQATAWLVRTNNEIFHRYALVNFAAVVMAGLPLIFAAYHIAFWTLAGRTPGKWILGLRLVTRDGSRVRLGRATLRLLCYLVSGLPLYAGFLWVLIDADRRAWHDRLTGTRVVYDRP